MKRRQFLSTASAAAAAVSTAGVSRIFGEGMPDLVAVKDGEPEAMFDAAIKEFGGMTMFVRKGQTVLVKPNIAWNSDPELASNTNPELTAAIIKHCLAAGASKVYVFDHTCSKGKSYQTSGIERAAKNAGAEVVPGEDEGYYQAVEIQGASKLTSAKVHEILFKSDVFINVPVLKHHGGAQLTIAMKNLMGIVWDRQIWHKTDLHQCIAEFCLYRKPDLNVVDAYRIATKGPNNKEAANVVEKKTLILSRDIVAADAAAAKTFGKEPETIPHIAKAAELHIGTMDLSALTIRRISL
jgi:uncharacterized protein (DUF362 family)